MTEVEVTADLHGTHMTQQSPGLLHAKATPSRPLETHYCTSIKMAV